jgi:isocitrate/isopropylmalate dehydrogenase
METSLSMSRRIAVIPADGIGIDVTAEAVKVLETVSKWRTLLSAYCLPPAAYCPPSDS